MQEQPSILICLKNKNEVSDLQKKLVNENSVVVAHTEEELTELLSLRIHDVLIIDLNFENADTLSICKELRNQNQACPFIIIVGDASEDYIKTIAFEAGADDYLEKPLNPLLVSVRIRAMMRRKKKEFIVPSHNSIRIDYEKRIVFRDLEKVELPRKEFMLMDLLYSNRGKTMTREEIALHMWKDETMADERNIDVYIANIRKKLGDEFIKTVFGKGYVMS